MTKLHKSPKNQSWTTELDILVETGDWAGVSLVAKEAKLEAAREIEGSALLLQESSSRVNKNQYNIHNSGIENTSIQQQSSSSQGAPFVTFHKMHNSTATLRANVEILVRRVVPDEIKNVDELMHQFQGREDELIETLRTMQERTIAAREREIMHSNAKLNALYQVKRI
jgi:hypothetical protein